MRDLPRALLAAALAVSTAFAPLAASAQERGSSLARPNVGSTTGATPPPASPAAPGEVPPPPGYGPDSARYPVGVRGPTLAAAGLDVNTATLLRVLNGDLQSLAARAGNGVLDGILGIVGGGLGIALGVLSNDGDPFISTYFYIWGAAGIARAVIDLSLQPRTDSRALAFSHMPMRNRAEIEARLVYGETALEYVANRTRLARLLDGSINVAAGAAAIPLVLASGNFDKEDFYFYFVIIGSSLSLIGGVVTLATRSDAEKRWNAYQEMRDNLTRTRQVSWEFGGAPLMGGGMATWRLRF